jgi:hypothetical protein
MLTLGSTPEFSVAADANQGARMNSGEIDENIPVACRVGAIPQQERARWLEVGRQFYASVQEVVELSDGYALRVSPDRLPLVAEYVMRDRLCCAFVRWEIVVEQCAGHAWLRVRGPEGTKDLLRAALERSDVLPLEVARAAGFSLDRRERITLDGVAALADDLSSG